MKELSAVPCIPPCIRPVLPRAHSWPSPSPRRRSPFSGSWPSAGAPGSKRWCERLVNSRYPWHSETTHSEKPWKQDRRCIGLGSKRSGRTDRRATTHLVATTVALVLSLGAGLLPAQIATSTLAVDTVVGDRVPLPGVTVVAVNPETGTERRGVADELGRVLLQHCPRVTIGSPPSSPVSKRRSSRTCALRVGDTIRLRLSLAPADRGHPRDQRRGAAGRRLPHRSGRQRVPGADSELPVIDRKFERLALLTPGVQGDRTSSTSTAPAHR